MRFWLRQDERRPSPEPVVTDDRAAFAVGLAAWLVLLIAALVLAPRLPQGWLWTAIAGVVLGVLGIAYTQLKRRRS